MSYSIENDSVPKGFHVGTLAGLSPDERADRQEARLGRYYGYGRRPKRLLSHVPASRTESHYDRSYTKSRPGDDLRHVLQGCVVDDLRRIASTAGAQKPLPTRKAEMVDLIMGMLPLPAGQFLKQLEDVDVATLVMVKRCLAGEEVKMPTTTRTSQLMPFLFTRQADSKSFVPKELLDAYSDVDLTPLVAHLKETEAIKRLVTEYVTLCGVSPASEVYGYYLRLNIDATLSEDDFLQCVRKLEKADETVARLHEQDGKTYLFHPRLEGSWGGDAEYLTDGGKRMHPTDNFRPSTMLMTLIERHEEVRARPLEKGELHLDQAADIYRLPCVQRLTSYFDCHVPNEEDDYELADQMVDILIESIMMRGTSLANVIWWLTRTGWYLAEGTNTAPRLTALVIDLFRDLPRWEFNGWSEREFIEGGKLPALVSERVLLEPSPQDIDQGIPANDLAMRIDRRHRNLANGSGYRSHWEQPYDGYGYGDWSPSYLDEDIPA